MEGIADGNCETSIFNRAFSTSEGGVPLTLQPSGGVLSDSDRWGSITGKIACYVADFEFFSACGIILDSAQCMFGGFVTWALRAAILKPGQAGMEPGTAELHLFLSNTPKQPLFGQDCEFLTFSHSKYTFASLPIDCTNWPWTEMEEFIVGTPFTLMFALGDGCDDGYYYYGDEPDDPGDLTCCEERRNGIGMPGTLYATLVRNGTEIANDLPLTNAPFGSAEYRYEGSNSPHPEGCDEFVLYRCDVEGEGGVPRLEWEQKRLHRQHGPDEGRQLRPVPRGSLRRQWYRRIRRHHDHRVSK
jgi:hypothetical protein